MSKTVLDFGASWAPFWVPFGFPFGSQEVPKRFRKAIQNWSKLFALRGTRRGGLEVEVLRGLEIQRLAVSIVIVANKM